MSFSFFMPVGFAGILRQPKMPKSAKSNDSCHIGIHFLKQYQLVVFDHCSIDSILFAKRFSNNNIFASVPCIGALLGRNRYRVNLILIFFGIENQFSPNALVNVVHQGINRQRPIC